jgi:hypothetical protein
MVQIAYNSVIAVLATAGIANCLTIKRDKPQGKVFDHILQVWFENQVGQP